MQGYHNVFPEVKEGDIPGFGRPDGWTKGWSLCMYGRSMGCHHAKLQQLADNGVNRQANHIAA